jgi:filamentous hemagglutinin
VSCSENPDLLIRSEATREEIANAMPGAIIAVNGILNDEKRGAELAYQNVEPDRSSGEKPDTVYLMHIAPAENTISELMAVAYEKITASADYGLANFLGYTSGQELYADLLRERGDAVTNSAGHSRGTLVQEAAFTILANRPNEGGSTYSNPNLFVRGVAGASNAEVYSSKAIQIVGERDKENVTYNYFSNDPVSALAGGNFGVTSLADLWSVFSTNNSMHSCMGTGAAECKQVEIPLFGGDERGTLEGNEKLIQYRGGRPVQRQPLAASDSGTQ